MQKNKPIVIGAAILGILAVGLTLMQLLGGRSAPPPAPAEPAKPPVVTQIEAARTIPPRTVITADMVRETTESTEPDGLGKREDVVGKLTGTTVLSGAIFKSAMLVQPLERAKPANFAVPAGLRAVALMVDPGATVGGIVDVGDRVDVVVMHRLKYRNEADQDGETRSGRTIGQDLLVLATDAALKKAETAPTPAPPTGPVDPNAPPPPPPAPTPPPPPPPAPGTPVAKVRVVVAATPVVAERLVAAQGNGELHLTLRDGIGRDQAAVPEVYEYPPYTLGRKTPVKKEKELTKEDRQLVKDIFNPNPAQPAAMMPPQVPQGLPPAGTGAMAPATAEVTVIRGTEKTKVEVPQR